MIKRGANSTKNKNQPRPNREYLQQRPAPSAKQKCCTANMKRKRSQAEFMISSVVRIGIISGRNLILNHFFFKLGHTYVDIGNLKHFKLYEKDTLESWHGFKLHPVQIRNPLLSYSLVTAKMYIFLSGYMIFRASAVVVPCENETHPMKVYIQEKSPLAWWKNSVFFNQTVFHM